MNANLVSLIRTLLTLAGAYLFGKNFFGLAIDEVLWQEIVGIAIGVVVIIWSAIDKTLQNDVWQGVVRHVITFASGILIARGVITAEMWQTILAALAGVLPWLQATLSNSKNAAIKSGDLNSSSFTK